MNSFRIGMVIWGVLALASVLNAQSGVEVTRFLEVTKHVGSPLSGEAGVDSMEDQTFVERETGPLKLDVYLPTGGGPFPGVLLVHGGGWTGGNKESFRAMAKRFAALGFTAVTTEYRLAGTAQFPAAVHDVKAAARWMRGNAERLKLDPEQLVAVGGSAGGHLVGMLATTGDETVIEGEGRVFAEQSCEVMAAVLMGAGVDQLTRAMDSAKPISSQLIFFGGSVKDRADIYREGSPIFHVSTATPPLLFLDGENDTPGERYVEMRAQMDALGVHHELTVVQGGKHGCWGSPPWREVMTLEMNRFFQTIISPQSDPAPIR